MITCFLWTIGIFTVTEQHALKLALQNSAAFEKMYLLCNTVDIIYCMNCILFLQGGIYYFVCLNPVYLTYDNGTGFSIPSTLITD